MKKIFKSVFSYLLICMLFCCPITNVYADEINTRIVSAEAMTISANNTYYIRNYKSNLYLDVAAPSYKELIQHSFMGGNNQRFVYQKQYSEIRSHRKLCNNWCKLRSWFSKSRSWIITKDFFISKYRWYLLHFKTGR